MPDTFADSTPFWWRNMELQLPSLPIYHQKVYKFTKLLLVLNNECTAADSAGYARIIPLHVV